MDQMKRLLILTLNKEETATLLDDTCQSHVVRKFEASAKKVVCTNYKTLIPVLPLMSTPPACSEIFAIPVVEEEGFRGKLGALHNKVSGRNDTLVAVHFGGGADSWKDQEWFRKLPISSQIGSWLDGAYEYSTNSLRGDTTFQKLVETLLSSKNKDQDRIVAFREAFLRIERYKLTPLLVALDVVAQTFELLARNKREAFLKKLKTEGPHRLTQDGENIEDLIGMVDDKTGAILRKTFEYFFTEQTPQKTSRVPAMFHKWFETWVKELNPKRGSPRDNQT